MIIGTHMSIAGGLEKTAKNVVKMEANTMQIQSWTSGTTPVEDAPRTP